jgi:RNA polymerase sigma-54 factor
VYLSPRDDFSSGGFSGDDLPEDNFSSTTEDLPTYVLRQIATELEEQDRKLAAFLVTNLDEDGLLAIPLTEAARYCHVPLSRVEYVLKLIQRADPIGVGSRSTQEALLVQLEVLSEVAAVPKLAQQIIEHGMDLLSRRQYIELAKKLRAPLGQVQKAVKFIGDNLNPFPARSHWGDARQPAAGHLNVYHQPDILISFYNEDPSKPLSVEIIMPLAGLLRVNPLFRRVIHEASEDKREAWKSDLDRASLFVKCLQQRNHTIQRLVQRVVSLQRDYIIYGEKYLKPATRAQLSKELGVHESTISRAVSNKTVQLPNRRIVPMSAFFDRSMNVRSVLRDMIAVEHRPLSDSELADMLAEKGYVVARRTVAKYRSMEGILPAHLRHPVA